LSQLPDLDDLLAKWQAILRLQDWDVDIGYYRAFDMLQGKQGTCKPTLTKKHAIIKILDPQDYDPDIVKPQDVECIVVHELIHLHFAPIDDDIPGGLPTTCLEWAVDALSRALVKLDRKATVGGV
jgi:hypothetical protein